MEERTQNSEPRTQSGRAVASIAVFVVLSCSLVCLLSPLTRGYSFAGGTGEPGDPYQIATAEQLISIGSDPNLLNRHFALVADIDLDPNKPFGEAAIAPTWGDGEEAQGGPFTGVLDGKGHTISHLTIKGGGVVGLVGRLGPGGEVRDLRVVDAAVTGSGPVGGLVGYSQGTVIGCLSSGMVSGQYGVGGLIGYNSGVVILSCSAGEVLGEGSLVGNGVGGVVGRNYKGRVSQCCSTAAVSGRDSVGGLVGENYQGPMTQCYSTGEVKGTGRSVGGLVGGNSGTTIGCFWDTQTSGRSTSAGGTGLTTAQMQDIHVYLDAGWDFVEEVKNGTWQVWQMPWQGGYPALAILSGYTPPQLQGLGTPQSPYLISDALDLGAMVYYSPYAHYRLGASIDLGGITWGTPVVPRFVGVFDGNDLEISHLTIKGGGDLGLFGELAPSAEVKGLAIVDVNIAGTESNLGGLAGTNWGTVTHCRSTGAVSGVGQDVGGLMGINGGTVTGCMAEGLVRCTRGARSGSEMGGLVGWNSGDVTWCAVPAWSLAATIRAAWSGTTQGQ